MAIDQVTGGLIKNDAITATKIADNAGNSEHVTAGAIDTAHIGDDQITAAKLGAGAVDTTALGANAVTAAKMADEGTLTTSAIKRSTHKAWVFGY